MRVLALITLCFAAVAAVPSNPQRIVGGTATTISTYPSIASLLYSWNLGTYLQVCGGTILNNRSVLTGAHCAFEDPPNKWRIRVGSTSANSAGIVHNVNQIILHQSYNPLTLNNDIAIMRSATVFVFTTTVRAALIASPNYMLGNNQTVWAVGWGATAATAIIGSEQLRHVQLTVIPQDTCTSNYAANGVTIVNTMLCSGWTGGGRGQCQGDSGGPLYHNGVVVGVNSFGMGCGLLPGVNTRVSRFTSWINGNA